MKQTHFSDSGLIRPWQCGLGFVIVTGANLSECTRERLRQWGLGVVVTRGLILSGHASEQLVDRQFDTTAIIGILEYGEIKESYDDFVVHLCDPKRKALYDEYYLRETGRKPHPDHDSPYIPITRNGIAKTISDCYLGRK